jgi:hypothetical protein
MPQSLPLVDAVAVTPTLLGDGNYPGILKIPYDFLYRAFRNTDFEGDIPQPDFAICREADEDMAVVAEESPIAHRMPSV